ncbi:myosin-G heavy chain isoform X1 [Lucilia sericata]|uniref:myosin-G heavy chain isoform X1 n=1 Tax=Lucilia sericata TaxID=13632 RepID=UPI0018A82352|nr:myosin-G heavy chain isoform X1 [Lucilia sericata]
MMNTATMYNKGNSLTNNNNNNSTSNLNISINNNGTTSSSTANNASGGGGSSTTTDRIEWSRATILDFIEDYRRQRVLWDPNTKGYHIKQTKYEALKLLGQKYGAEIRSIRSKIKSLRSSFHREHGKVLNGRRKGLNYQPMWFAYDAIRFILDGESGDSDEAEVQKNDSNRETTLSEPNNNNNNNISNLSIDEELMEERKISSRDIEHFNNHFLALGLQARHPMAVIAAVEAAAAASAAQERRRDEQKYAAIKQQEIDSATQLKLLELSTNATTTTTANTNTNNSMNLTSTSATFNPISKPFNSPKPSSPIATNNTNSNNNSSVPITTATLSNTNATTTPHQLLPPPSSTSTCSPESLNVLHGSRSLDENSASALAAATAIPSLSITAVARNSDFDGSEYCNISAEDVKTEIFESDSTDLAMLESTRTSTPVPLNYHKNATDLTMNRSNTNANNSGNNPGGTGTVGSRKRKAQMHSNVNHNEDAPSPSKLNQKQQQHSNAIHSRQCDYLNSNNNQSPDDNAAAPDDDDGDDDEDDGAGYSTSFSHLQTTLLNSNSNNGNNNPTTSNNGKTNNCSNNPIDEYGVFGEYVAITIRKLKTSKAKIVVKHLINNLLYEAEMGKYDQGISSCKEPPELYKM